jgi:CubicO group peptidase (beta-lactamase class C family)
MANTEVCNQKLQKVLDSVIDGRKIVGTSFSIKKNDFTWHGGAGNLSPEIPYFIASTTKLFVTALVLKMRSENKITLEDKICNYLDHKTLNNLHVYKGIDYTSELTIKHLLAHTSGLPDYFQGKGPNGKSLEDEIKLGNDSHWTFEEAIERSKTMQPLFRPGAKNSANYSDANFQLLGKIIETISGKSFEENCKELIFKPLNLEKTYLYQDPTDNKPLSLFYESKKLLIPKAMTSFGADGGIVSTSQEMLVFIEAFFTGKLFPKSYLSELQEWNRIFFPMKAGIGIHLFKLPWIFNPFGSVPYFIGHSGLSGALAYYALSENLFIAGTVNQVAHPDISFRTMIKLTQVIRKI